MERLDYGIHWLFNVLVKEPAGAGFHAAANFAGASWKRGNRTLASRDILRKSGSGPTGDGNRTHASSLGSSRSTIELHPPGWSAAAAFSGNPRWMQWKFLFPARRAGLSDAPRETVKTDKKCLPPLLPRC